MNLIEGFDWMIFLFDSWAWIEYALDSEHKEKVKQEYLKADNKIITTKINLYEVYAKVGNKKGWEKADDTVDNIIENVYVTELDLDVIKDAAHLKNEKGLSTADSIVAATAIKYRAILLTGDHDFDLVKDKIKIKYI